MLSLNSAKAGSRELRGKSGRGWLRLLPWGVDCEARRLVREGGRRGVVGREGIWAREEARWWEGGAGVVEAIVLLFGMILVASAVDLGRKTRLGG